MPRTLRGSAHRVRDRHLGAKRWEDEREPECPGERETQREAPKRAPLRTLVLHGGNRRRAPSPAGQGRRQRARRDRPKPDKVRHDIAHEGGSRRDRGPARFGAAPTHHTPHRPSREKDDRKCRQTTKESLGRKDLDRVVVCLGRRSAPLDLSQLRRAVSRKRGHICVDADPQQRMIPDHAKTRAPQLETGPGSGRAQVRDLLDA